MEHILSNRESLFVMKGIDFFSRQQRQRLKPPTKARTVLLFDYSAVASYGYLRGTFLII